MSSNHIIIVGDLFPIEQNMNYFSKGDICSLFGDEIVRLFSTSVFSVCNLEGALTDNSERCIKTGPVKVAPKSVIEAYKKLGINCCMLANNHVTDGGNQGLLDTMQALDEAGIQYIGAGKSEKEIIRSFVKEVGGRRIGFYNVSETMYNKPAKDWAGAWLYDEYVVCDEIKELNQKCEYLVVIYHGGVEKFPYPSPEMRKRFHRMADNGADMILAQHTHCIGCEEYYKDSYLLYGQGDFLLKNFAPGLTDSGLIIELEIENGQVQVKKHKVRSVDNLFVRYCDDQDFSCFKERSGLLNNGEYIEEQFEKFCYNELRLYLEAFKSPSKIMRLVKRFFPKVYRNWLYNYSFSQRDFLFTLHTLRSEQNRETAINGMEYILKKNNYYA